MMSCLLIVSWVIEVEYTLTAIPQLGKKREKKRFLTFWQLFSKYNEYMLPVQKRKENSNPSLCLLRKKG